MEKDTQHIFESIIKNDCRALKEITNIDKTIAGPYKKFILREIAKIEKETDPLKKMQKMTELIIGIYKEMNLSE